ncbi:hypothetical protein EVAR_38193_1 [Eumeta japonica]|uniref:Uncharacterized protein n=1 Tax=Eumeta variegata TaxID=151549 RepID=A0A4C1WH17_EUMVA|nr:hypothetical protein EVAR_38193_1 [Eumeta japonica]
MEGKHRCVRYDTARAAALDVFLRFTPESLVSDDALRSMVSALELSSLARCGLRAANVMTVVTILITISSTNGLM